MNRKEQAIRSARLSILVNILLAGVKLLAGIAANSGAMIGDAVHSFSDVLTTVCAIVSLRLAARGADKDHPYGHDRLESLAAVLMACALAFTGFELGRSGITELMEGSAAPTPGLPALAAAVLSVIVKEIMFRVTRRTAQRTHSPALLADAWHHRSDALSSVGAFAGILASRLGFAQGDALASIVICLFILKASVDIFRTAASQLTDRACPPETEEKLRAVILAQPGVLSVDELRTRLFGPGIYADAEISADGSLSLYEAHAIAEKVHTAVESAFPQLRHCTVHVNPSGAPEAAPLQAAKQ